VSWPRARRAPGLARRGRDASVPIGAGRLFHWSAAEPGNLSDNYKNARDRQPGIDWPEDLPWYDLLVNVVRAAPLGVTGAFAFDLKTIARAMHATYPDHAKLASAIGRSFYQTRSGLSVEQGRWRREEVGAPDVGRLRAALGLPDEFVPIGVMPMGRPLPDVRSPSLKRGWVPFDEFAHWERW
jgi:hypothetical protein